MGLIEKAAELFRKRSPQSRTISVPFDYEMYTLADEIIDRIEGLNFGYRHGVRAEINRRVPQAQSMVPALKEALEPFKGEGRNWSAALVDARIHGLRMVRDARAMFRQEFNQLSLYELTDRLIEDDPNNPWAVLLPFYRAGLVKVHFADVEGDQRFVAHFPIRRRNESRKMELALGCWVEDDPRVYFWHPWNKHDCDPLVPFPRIKTPERNLEPRFH